jgi:Leucine Rich repeats (2 copies)
MLTHLDLSGNQFSSEIPSSIGQLTNLVKLHLHRNRLEGSIPIELGMLSSAYTIRINDNDISGSVPEEVCENFGIINPLFYLDCLPQSDGFVEITCPPGKCCAVCCNDEGACECKYRGTTFEFLCDAQQ